MSYKLHTFAVASDEALVMMIKSAQKRLVVIAPALTKPVADAISQRLDDLGKIDVTVILDSDPEVYRLGFGDKGHRVKSFVASCWLLLERSLTRPAHDEIHFAGLSTTSDA